MAMMTVSARGAGRRPHAVEAIAWPLVFAACSATACTARFQEGVVSMIHGVMSTGSRVDGVRGEISERTGLATAPEHPRLMVT